MSDSSAIERGWLSLNEAARYVGVSRDKLRAAAYQGELRARIRPQANQGEWYAYQRLAFHRRDLDAWVYGCWSDPTQSEEMQERKRTARRSTSAVPNLKEVK